MRFSVLFFFGRWSAIAARLPGRTDNEIKNVWHTHLKKRLTQNHVVQKTKRHHHHHHNHHQEAKVEADQVLATNPNEPVSPPQCSSITTEDSSVTTTSITDVDDHNNNTKNRSIKADSSENFSEMDEDFWSEVFSSANNSEVVDDFSAISSTTNSDQLQFSMSPLVTIRPNYYLSSNMYDEDMDFWYNIFTRPADLPELLL